MILAVKIIHIDGYLETDQLRGLHVLRIWRVLIIFEVINELKKFVVRKNSNNSFDFLKILKSLKKKNYIRLDILQSNQQRSRRLKMFRVLSHCRK